MSGDCRGWKWAEEGGNTWRGESFLLLKDDLATGAVPSESKFLGRKKLLFEARIYVCAC